MLEILQRPPLPTSIAVVIALVLGLVSTLLAPSLPLAANDWGHTLLWIVGLIGLTAAMASPALRRMTRGILVLVLLAVIAQFLISLSTALRAGDGKLLAQWWVMFSNPRFVSQILIWTVPLACVLRLPDSSRWASVSQLASMVMGCFGFMLMFWVGGRGALIGSVGASILCLLLSRRTPPGKSAGWRVMSCFGLGALLYFTAPWLLDRLGLSAGFGEVLLRSGLSARDVLWARSLAEIAAHPLLGMGPGHYAVDETANWVMQAHPHNLVLQWASEWGLAAAAAFSFAWAGLLLRFGQKVATNDASEFNGDQTAYGQALFISVVAASFLALFDGVLVMPWSILLGTLVCSLSIHWVMSRPTAPSPFRPAPLAPLWMGAYVVALVTATATTALGGWAIRPCFYLGYPPPEKIMDPRFWVDGEFSLGPRCGKFSTAPVGMPANEQSPAPAAMQRDGFTRIRPSHYQ